MKPTETLRDRNRLVRTLSAVGLALLSLRSLRRGNRLRGALAGFGAVALGYSASNGAGDVTELDAAELDTGGFDSDGDSTTADAESAPETDGLECPVCGDPIVAGERRKPNDEGETVHEACLEATA